MQKLLEETLLCDISTQIEPYEYGQRWCNIENHLKKIITKDNQVINKTSPKKLVLSLNKTTILRNYPNKESPNESQDSTKLYTSSIHQNPHEKTKKVRSIYQPQQLELETDFIEQQKENNEFQTQTKDFVTFIQQCQKNELPQNECQIKKQSHNIIPKKEQFQVYRKIQRPNNLKFQYKNIKTPSFQTLGQSLFNLNCDFNKKLGSEKPKKILKKDQQQKKNNKISTWQQCNKEKQIYNSNSQTNFRIKRFNSINNHGQSQNNLMNYSKINRAKTKHKYLQIKNVCILLDNQQKGEPKRLNQNQNYRLIKSASDYKKEINHLKTHIFQQGNNPTSNVYIKKYQFTKGSTKSLHQKSIVFPLVERPNIENKKQKFTTTQKVKAYTSSQSKKFSQQRPKTNQKSQLMLTADKKRVQSIKLVVKKQKKSEQSQVSKQIFQEIDIENNQQKGTVRKLKMSQLMQGRFLLNGSADFKQNKPYLSLSRDRNSKSCLIKTNQIIYSSLNSNKISFQQPCINPRQSTNKRSLFFCNKKEDILQKSVSHSDEKSKYSKQKLQKMGKQNLNRKVIKKDKVNISLVKLQLNKHQSKLIIFKK